MKQRIITGVIAAALFIPFVVLGGLPFSLLVYAMAAVGLYEILRMKGISLFSVQGILTLLTMFILLMPNDWEAKVLEVTSYSKMEFLFLGAILLLIYTVLIKNKFTYDEVGFVIISVLYVGMGFHYLIETRMEGLEYVIYALVIVWTTDSGAYFVGRKLGKNKLWPEISPNKTIEGFVGGIVTAIVFAILFQLIVGIETTYVTLIIVTVIASIFGQLGDLVESAIKRHYDVKDSGKILPGHGGILDRFDSLLFVLPLLHFLHFVG
ncbi:phosphatidate cytidylyltransferase [Viridibacillus sp. FSL R5-0477]|uniref:Phosphatidate cytidylyltransferase n=1 Tax=Viridibacillus arenosi FSL R5-213 TaxID=1227360 RepID=W4EZD4_9BACL|nr:phosphatidate cytidylyltransferase [Viridibacillus arenosi]ETT85890.1 phosphatidate cytidylyltransferase [Viridibacillus arenosi FSL R5-213]OMC93409.1 phosphatidate cytidylyltransferase [Viridibacillus arenosi]